MGDIELMHRHLETSNKPSARVSMMLSKIRTGDPLPEPDKRIAPGSYLDKKNNLDTHRKEGGERDRLRGSRSRDRGRRSRSRDRDRKSRSRDRDRDRRR